MEKLLDKKQIQAIFLFEFQMGHKAAETAHNINNAVSPGPANERMVQWSFKNFCKRQEPWRWGAKWPAIGNWERPGERITEADLTTACWKVQHRPFYSRSAFEPN